MAASTSAGMSTAPRRPPVLGFDSLGRRARPEVSEHRHDEHRHYRRGLGRGRGNGAPAQWGVETMTALHDRQLLQRRLALSLSRAAEYEWHLFRGAEAHLYRRSHSLPTGRRCCPGVVWGPTSRAGRTAVRRWFAAPQVSLTPRSILVASISLAPTSGHPRNGHPLGASQHALSLLASTP